MRHDELGPYTSVEEMVRESATMLMDEREGGGREVRSWVLPSEVAFHTGLDEHVVIEAMLRLDERTGESGSSPPQR